MGSLRPVLLLTTVLYNVMFVATVSVAAVWPKNYVRTVDLDANVGMAPSSVRDPAVPGQERPGRGHDVARLHGPRTYYSRALRAAACSSDA